MSSMKMWPSKDTMSSMKMWPNKDTMSSMKRWLNKDTMSSMMARGQLLWLFIVVISLMWLIKFFFIKNEFTTIVTPTDTTSARTYPFLTDGAPGPERTERPMCQGSWDRPPTATADPGECYLTCTDPRTQYESTTCQGDENPTTTNHAATTNPAVVCSGTHLTCTGTYLTCRGLNVKCTGTNLDAQAEENVYRGDSLTCSGDSVVCTGRGMICKRSHQPPCPAVNLPHKPLPVLYRDVNPDPSQYNIYLIETSASASLLPRFFCILESYCKMNPGAVVWLLTTACQLDETSTRHLTALRDTYHNLEVATLNVALALRGTPLEPLYYSKVFWVTTYLFIHLSDILRLAVVYKSGGFYTDTDIIALKSVTNMTNIIAREDSTSVNNAIFHFVRGHPFLWVEMADIARNYRGDVWGQQGPKAITRVLIKHGCFLSTIMPLHLIKKIPDIERVGTKEKYPAFNQSSDLKICDLTILSEGYFYPVSWNNWLQLFSPWPDSDDNDNSTLESITNPRSIDKIFPESYGIHLYNHLSIDNNITRQSILSTVFPVVSPSMLYPNL